MDFRNIPIRMLDAIINDEATIDSVPVSFRSLFGDDAEIEMPIEERLAGWWEWFTRVYGEAPRWSGTPRRRLYVDRDIMTRIDVAAFAKTQMWIRYEVRGQEPPRMTYKGIEIVQDDDVVGIVPAELVNR